MSAQWRTPQPSGFPGFSSKWGAMSAWSEIWGKPAQSGNAGLFSPLPLSDWTGTAIEPNRAPCLGFRFSGSGPLHHNLKTEKSLFWGLFSHS